MTGFVGLTSNMTSPVTSQDDHLLDDLAPGLPMDMGPGDMGLSRAPSTECNSHHETPMLQGSPALLPGTG